MYQYNESPGLQVLAGFNRNINSATTSRGAAFTVTARNSSPYFPAYSNIDQKPPVGNHPYNRNLLEVQRYQTANATPSKNLRQTLLSFSSSPAQNHQVVRPPIGRSEQNKTFLSLEFKAPNGRVSRASSEPATPRAKPKVVKREEKSASRKTTETMRIFSGNAEKIIKWNKKQKSYFCLYELFASIVSIQAGSVRLQQVMLLRDKKGPIIQVVHYVNDHINIENFFVGQMLRCVGRMIGPNMMHAVSIREATEEEVFTMQRISYICDDAVSKSTKG